MYVDLAGLARYKSDFDAWARGALLPKDAAAARVRTAKAGAVSFVPVQRTPLDVSVDFLFTETPPASGDKSPTNPSTIAGVSSVKVTRCGRNLVPVYTAVYETFGIKFTPQSDGSFKITGTTDGVNHAYYTILNPFYLAPGVKYTISLRSSISRNGITIVGRDSNNQNAFSTSLNTPLTITGDGTTVRARLAINRTVGEVDCVVYPQIEVGETETAFETYEGTDYTLPFGGTYYGGTLDVASGVMTVKSQKLMIDENCIFTFFNDPVTTTETRIAIIVTIPSFPTAAMTKVLRATSSCDSFPFARIQTAGDSLEYIMFGDEYQYVQYKQFRIYMLRSTLGVSSSATATEINNAAKAWFTSHPATFIVGYDEEPRWTTVQLTPTEILSLTQSSVYDPRVNTVYGDASAVQVGYLKHPSAASVDLRDAVVSLGGGV